MTKAATAISSSLPTLALAACAWFAAPTLAQPPAPPTPTPPAPLPSLHLKPQEPVWDWKPMTDTSIDMRPMFYPVKNQLFRGSCATFAVVGAMEFYPGVPRLSEAYLYSTLKAEAYTVDGASLDEMKKYLDTTPLVADEVLPYELVGVFAFDEKNVDESRIGRAFNEKKGRQAKLVEDRAIYKAKGVRVYKDDEITWDLLERTLREGKPIVCGFQLNGTHWSKSGGFIHSDTVKLKDGSTTTFKNDGGHAVLAVGYRTIYDPEGTGPIKERKLIHQLCIRNSWGPQWGSQGYGWVSWETYGKGRLTQAMTIDGVELVNVGRLDRAPDIQLRAQGFKFKKDDYAVTLSCVVKSFYLPEGGIKSVTYTLYSGAAKMNEAFEKFPLVSKTTTDPTNGFMTNFTGLSDNSLNVKMEVTYALGGTGTFWCPVPEILVWSPSPDVEVPPEP